MSNFTLLPADAINFNQLPAAVLDAIFQGVTGQRWECVRCHVTGTLQVFSTEYQWGKLFTADFRQPGFDLGHIQLLCNPCRAEWLMWQARMGFDLHSHASGSPCDGACFAQRDGRRAQFQALRSAATDSKVGFVMAKAIDGLPRLNGTTGLTCQRIAFLQNGWLRRQGYYESVGSPEHLAMNLQTTKRLRSIGVGPQMVDDHLIVVKVFQSAYTAPNGVLSHPVGEDPFVDLHCVAVEEYDESSQSFRFWNNWGSGWGDHGYGTMALEYAQDFFHEAWIFRHARWGPIPAKRERVLLADDNPRELRRIWSIENPRFVGRLAGPGSDHNSRWCLYQTMSPTLDCPITCIEVRTGFGLRMGWAFVRHLRNGTAEVTELFVWPTFRRAGIGSWLEAQCVAQAASNESTELDLILNEADSVIGPLRKEARRFASAHGYTMHWRNRVGPRSPATAVKAA